MPAHTKELTLAPAPTLMYAQHLLICIFSTFCDASCAANHHVYPACATSSCSANPMPHSSTATKQAVRCTTNVLPARYLTSMLCASTAAPWWLSCCCCCLTAAAITNYGKCCSVSHTQQAIHQSTAQRNHAARPTHLPRPALHPRCCKHKYGPFVSRQATAAAPPLLQRPHACP